MPRKIIAVGNIAGQIKLPERASPKRAAVLSLPVSTLNEKEAEDYFAPIQKMFLDRDQKQIQ